LTPGGESPRGGRLAGSRLAAISDLPQPIDPALRIASVELAVADLDRSVDFYDRVLGLPLIARQPERATLGLERERPALELSALERPTAAPPNSTGLFHVAWLHTSRAALAETVQRLLRERWRISGASDHGVSEALYLSDPDGLGIEIYADRPREQWQRPPSGVGVEMATMPLDVEDLLAQHPAAPAPLLDAGTTIGHVHLKVSDVPRAASFYRDVLGFAEQAQMPSAAFLSAGGHHHHIGLNSWQSRGAHAAPDSAPGLRRIEFELSGAGALQALEQRLADAGVASSDGAGSDGKPARAIAVRDSDGELLAFAAP
jgi:catechol 2,3-dioxygenase